MGRRKGIGLPSVVFFLLTVAAVVVSVWLIHERVTLIQAAEVQDARIVACDYKTGVRRTQTTYRWAPVAISEQGVRVQGSLWWDERDFCERRLNKPVTVYVHPTNPRENRINSFFQLWLYPVLAVLASILLINGFYVHVRRLNLAATAIVAAVCGIAYLMEFPFAEDAPDADPMQLSRLILDSCIAARMDEKQLSRRSQIKVLSCYGLGISDLSSIADLVNLEELGLGKNKLTSLWTMGSYPRLKRLYVYENQLTSLRGVERLAQLEELHADGNALSDLRGLEQLGGLRVLSLNKNRLQNIDGLRQLSALEELYLSHNQVTDVGPLADKLSLRKLLIYSNNVMDVSPLYGNRAMKIAGIRGEGKVPCHQIDTLRGKLEPDAKVVGQGACDRVP